MLQVVKCAYSVYWIDDASSNQSGQMLLFPFIDDLGIPTILYNHPVRSGKIHNYHTIYARIQIKRWSCPLAQMYCIVCPREPS